MRKTRIAALLLGVLVAGALAACGHKEQPASTGAGTPTAPTPPAPTPSEPTTPPSTPTPTPTPQVCTYTLAVAPDAFPREGGSGTLTIGTAAGCDWTFKQDATWVAIEGPGRGTGPALLAFSVRQSDETATRRMTISLADKAVVLSQSGQTAPADCAYQVSPVIVSLPRIPWTGEIAIATTPGCRWTAVSDSPWARLQSTAGSGPARLTYTTDFSAETGYAVTRTAVIAIRWDTPTAGQNVRISQWGACNVGFAAPPEGAPGFSGYPGGTVTVGPGGGETHLFVLTDPWMGCAWSVESDDSWITVNFPGLHRVAGGDGDIRFTIPPNPLSTSRQGKLMVGDRALTIIQNGR